MARPARDPQLQQRGRMVRALGRLREMLPGALVYRRRACGKPNCRCAQGKEHWHGSYQLVVSERGSKQPRTYHVPHEQVEEVRHRIELRHELEALVRGILQINLKRWLSGKKKK